jgi:hypothetical protein
LSADLGKWPDGKAPEHVRQRRRHGKRRADGLPLTWSEIDCLVSFGDRLSEGKPPTQSDIARDCGFTKANAHRLYHRLADMGVIEMAGRWQSGAALSEMGWAMYRKAKRMNEPDLHLEDGHLRWINFLGWRESHRRVSDPRYAEREIWFVRKGGNEAFRVVGSQSFASLCAKASRKVEDMVLGPMPVMEDL